MQSSSKAYKWYCDDNHWTAVYNTTHKGSGVEWHHLIALQIHHQPLGRVKKTRSAFPYSWHPKHMNVMQRHRRWWVNLRSKHHANHKNDSRLPHPLKRKMSETKMSEISICGVCTFPNRQVCMRQSWGGVSISRVIRHLFSRQWTLTGNSINKPIQLVKT